MQPSDAATVVVLDLGEVLASPTGLLAELAGLAGLDEPALTAAYWAHRDPHDRGGDADTYWRAVLAGTAAADDEALRSRLTARDAQAWATLRPDSRDTLAELHAAGVPVAILSNAPHPMAQAARAADWSRWVDAWFFSAELGEAKPHASVYAAVTGSLGIAPEQVVFFDDRSVNVDAARRAGWRAYLWTSGAATRATLRELGLLPR